MMLNLHVLRDDLLEWNLKGNLIFDRLTMNLRSARLCRKLPDHVAKDVLYIVEASTLKALPAGAEGISILCSGTPSVEWLIGFANILYTAVPFELEDMMNCVCEIFDRYQSWEDSLQELVDQHKPLVEFAKKSFPIFQNPLYAQGPGFRVLFMYLPENVAETPRVKSYQALMLAPGEVMSVEGINELISDSEYRLSDQMKESHIYHGKPYGFPSLIFNIIDEGVNIARITVDEVLAPLRDKDFALAPIYGNYLRKALISKEFQMNTVFDQPANLDYVLKGLLTHTLLPEEEIRNVLRDYCWNGNDTYFCMVMQFKLNENCSYALNPIALKLSEKIKQNCYSIVENNIVYVINLSLLKMSRQEAWESITVFLRDNLLSAASSMEFCDFKELYYYYQQALETMKLGNQKDPMLWYYRFEDYQFEYLLDKYQYKTRLETLIPDGLKRLQEHDQKKGTDFMTLLKIYLDKERNVADTIRNAFIHRNTFLYRMNRIEEIVDMDLNDPNVRILLQISFRLLEKAEEKTILTC